MIPKYLCQLSYNAEGRTTGTMYLTASEYELIKRVTKISNWENLQYENFCGSLHVWCDELEEWNKNEID